MNPHPNQGLQSSSNTCTPPRPMVQAHRDHVQTHVVCCCAMQGDPSSHLSFAATQHEHGVRSG